MLKKHFLSILLLGAVILSFTSIYTAALVVALVALVTYRPFRVTTFLDSWANRFIVTFLFFIAWLVSIAMFAWATHLSIYCYLPLRPKSMG
jgi:hypothetical protein